MLLPKQVTALGRIASREPERVYSAIRVERSNGRPRAIATDGRRAVVFSWEEPDADQFPAIDGLSPRQTAGFAANVPAKALADAGRGIASRLPDPVLGYMLLDESDAKLVRVAATARDNVTRAQAKAHEGAFPSVDDVMPTPARDGTLYDPRRHDNCGFTHVRIGVNARQLAETLAVVADLANDDYNNVVVLTVPIAGNRPIRLDAQLPDREAAAVVMPCNITAQEEQSRSAPAVPSQAKESPRNGVDGARKPAATITPPNDSRFASRGAEHGGNGDGRPPRSLTSQRGAMPAVAAGREAPSSVRRPAPPEAPPQTRRKSVLRSLRDLF